MVPINFLIFLMVLTLSQVVRSSTNCTSIGLQCSDDCNSIDLCPSIGVEPFPVVHCNTHVEGLCKKSRIAGNFDCSGAQCSSPKIFHPFTCTGSGTYPSAYNCDVSYVCGNGRRPIKTCKCDSGLYYDTATESCEKEFDCPLIPADCSALGRIGKLGNGFCYTCDRDYQAVVFPCYQREVSPELQPTNDRRGMTCSDYREPKMEPRYWIG